ncbi:V8-like Glu-specific endopeptidase [Frankia sp. AiPs1]|uniref:trypsin-like serine peptidase n=1 Tax=Frankia sp. AiPa1 TaxID=573492 RepID=UPI00202B119A|nr:hypothetical protein [Frankia sp. AiPa1]
MLLTAGVSLAPATLPTAPVLADPSTTLDQADSRADSTPTNAPRSGDGTADPAGVPVAPTATGAITDTEQAQVRRYWTAEHRNRAFGSRSSSGLSTDAAPARSPFAAEPGPGPVGAPPPASDGTPYIGGGLVTATTGRLFTTIDGSDFACSASVVNSAGRNLVVTAGHCLHGGAGSQFAGNVAFVPGYADGTMPYGIWTARRMTVTSGWSQKGDFDVDAGFVTFNPRNGRRLQDVVGAQNIAFDLPSTVPQYIFGYPRLSPFDGNQMIYCAGPDADDPYGGPSMGVRCRMTAGASGGPFLTGFGRLGPGHGWIDGVVSYAYAGSSGRLYGTHFGAVVRRLYDQSARL